MFKDSFPCKNFGRIWDILKGVNGRVPEVKIHEYPSKSKDLFEKTAWLFAHSKKKNQILYLKTLVESFHNNDFLEIIYEKDATSSGLQIISKVMRDPLLTLFTNLIGLDYFDIYDRGLDFFNKKLKSQREFLNSFFSNVFNKILEEFLK